MQATFTETRSLLDPAHNQDGYPPSPETSLGLQGADNEDAPIDVLTSRYGSLGTGYLSLSGTMEGFGTPFARCDPASLYDPTERFVRPSRPTIQYTAAQNTKTEILSTLLSDPGEGVIPRKYLHDITEVQFWSCFTCIFLVCFTSAFDTTLMASSHPAITSYFGASNAASWLSTSFLLTSTAFQPILSRMSDTFGRRIIFVLSLTIFTLGTLWCALASTILQLIYARAICGLGAAGAHSMGTVIIGDLVPQRDRGRYVAVLNLASGIGSSLGAAAGGLMAETIGWRWEFGIQVPAIALCAAIAYYSTPPALGPMLCRTSRTPQSFLEAVQSFDMAGSALLTSSVTFMILALNLGGNPLPWTCPFIILCLVLSAALVIALIFVERSVEKPVMPLYMLCCQPQGNLIFSNFLSCMTMSTIMFNLPLYFQAVLLDTPARSGARLIIPFLANMIASVLTGNYISWSLQFRHTVLLGAVLILAGSIGLTIMSPDLPSPAYSWLAALAAGGQGFNFPTISIAVLAINESDDIAVATSTLNLFRSLGTVLGVAVSSLVTQNGLNYFLENSVTGPRRAQTINEVKASVGAIKRLEGIVRDQVINAYTSAMRLTFSQAIASAIGGFLLIVVVRLPRLCR